MSLFKAAQLRLKELHHRYRKFLPAFFFIAGFIWDSLTLTRIDSLSDNLIMLAYLISAGILILLIQLINHGRLNMDFLNKYSHWLPSFLQFLFGGLFSCYVIFYFQSASLTKSIVFMLILVSLFVANEFLERKLNNLYLQVGLYFFLCFSFFIFFVPVIIKKMNFFTFILAGFMSLLLTGSIIYILRRCVPLSSEGTYYKLLALTGSLYLILNSFYFLNLIPPVPLSLKFIGIYNHITQENGSFTLQYEKPPWYKFWQTSSTNIHHQEGERVYCFSAIFAPTQLTKKIYHHWQYYSEKSGWVSASKIGFQIVGGRGKGYRGYTFKSNLNPGKWRVNVETEEGLIIGRVNFYVQRKDPSKVYPLKTVQY